MFYEQNNSSYVHFARDPRVEVESGEHCVKQATFCVGPAGPWEAGLTGPYGGGVNLTRVNVTAQQKKSDLYSYGPYQIDVLGSPVFICNGGCVVQNNVHAQVNVTGYATYAIGQNTHYKHWEFEYNTSNGTGYHLRTW